MRGVIKFEKTIHRFARKMYRVSVKVGRGTAHITRRDGGLLSREHLNRILNFCDRHGFSASVTSVRVGRGTEKRRKR